VSEHRRTWLAFFGVIAAWGSSYLFIRLALHAWQPLGLVATRFGVAGLLCALIARWRGETFPRGRQLAALLLVGVLMMSGSNALTAWAQRTVSSGLAGVMHSLGSVWLAAFGALPGVLPAGARRPRPAFWLGVFGGVFGVLVLLWPGEGTLEADVPGVLALLAATVIFAVASLLQRAWQARGPSSLFGQLAAQMLGGSTVAFVLASLGSGFLHAEVTPGPAAAVAWLILVASIGGFACFALVLRGWPPSRAGSYAVVNPIVSVLLGVAFAGESVTPRMVLGAGVTLVSVAWVQWCHRQPPALTVEA